MSDRWWLGLAGALLALIAVFQTAWPEKREAVRLAERPAPDRRDTLPVPDAAPPVAAAASASVERPVSIRWHTVTVDDNLGEILAAARRSTNPEDRYAALMIAVNCIVIPNDSIDEETAAYIEPDAMRRAAMLERVASARRRMTDFCRTGDSAAYMNERAVSRSSQSSPSRRFSADLYKSKQKQLGEWGPVVLAAPQDYPTGFNAWLQSMMPKLLPDPVAKSQQQREAVTAELYRRFMGETPDNSVLAVAPCMHFMNCTDYGTPSAEQQAAVEAAASALEKNIREQRWEALQPH